jgi:signal transduction histidine kinase
MSTAVRRNHPPKKSGISYSRGGQTQSPKSSTEDVAEQALLAERTQTVLALEARVRKQIAVAEFSQRALECRTLSNLFEEAAPTVAKIVDVEFCEILELLLSEQSLLMIAGVGWESDYIGRVVFATDHKSQGGFALLSGVPIIVNNLNKERRFEPPQLFLDHGIVSGISVIIQGRTGPLGILGAHTTKLRKFTDDDVHFLQSVASVLAAAIERSGLEQELLMISRHEQQRIAQDLHDGLCQQLVGIEFRNSALAHQPALTAEARYEVLEIGEMLRNVTRQARGLIHGLSPIQVEVGGLMSALQGLTENASDLFKVSSKFRCPRPVRIEKSEVAGHLYRIAQEAIGNAIQHGQAKQILVSLKQLRQTAILAIEDNGSGFSREAAKVGGMGLRIMEYRAAVIGALLTIESKRQSGTKVTCKLHID